MDDFLSVESCLFACCLMGVWLPFCRLFDLNMRREKSGSRQPLAIYQQPAFGAFLMDTGGVRKGVAPDDGLAELHGHTHEHGNQTVRRYISLLLTSVYNLFFLWPSKNHNNLFERGVSGTLANAVDSYLHPPRSIENIRNAIRYGHYQVVVTVRVEYNLVDAGRVLDEILDFVAVLVRQRVAGNVDNVGGCREC
jgi:hypothetical protein